MKGIEFFKGLYIVGLLLVANNGIAQKKVSFDLAAIRNMKTDLNGLNISSFYHFTERIEGGLEMNRFFLVSKKKGEEDIRLSAWDFDLNFHYVLPIHKNLKFYPLTGISHTSEKEENPAKNEIIYQRFWSFNTGAGILWEIGKWSPHMEYSFTWGKMNQQFLLAGISYIVEMGHHEKEKNEVTHL
jgi:hypothetical protein